MCVCVCVCVCLCMCMCFVSRFPVACGVCRVFQSDTPGSEPKLTLNIRHNNYVGRWLTPFRAVWDPKSDSHFVVGSMSHPRQVWRPLCNAFLEGP